MSGKSRAAPRQIWEDVFISVRLIHLVEPLIQSRPQITVGGGIKKTCRPAPVVEVVFVNRCSTFAECLFRKHRGITFAQCSSSGRKNIWGVLSELLLVNQTSSCQRPYGSYNKRLTPHSSWIRHFLAGPSPVCLFELWTRKWSRFPLRSSVPVNACFCRRRRRLASAHCERFTLFVPIERKKKPEKGDSPPTDPYSWKSQICASPETNPSHFGVEAGCGSKPEEPA